MISPSKCPVCDSMAVYGIACDKCWYVSPVYLEQVAQATRTFLKYWDVDTKTMKLERVEIEV